MSASSRREPADREALDLEADGTSRSLPPIGEGHACHSPSAGATPTAPSRMPDLVVSVARRTIP
jgi:hypothetical protein